MRFFFLFSFFFLLLPSLFVTPDDVIVIAGRRHGYVSPCRVLYSPLVRVDTFYPRARIRRGRSAPVTLVVRVSRRHVGILVGNGVRSRKRIFRRVRFPTFSTRTRTRIYNILHARVSPSRTLVTVSASETADNTYAHERDNHLRHAVRSTSAPPHRLDARHVATVAVPRQFVCPSATVRVRVRKSE